MRAASSASRPSARSGVAVRPRRNGARHARAARARQVVALVENDQSEARAEVLHVEHRRIVRRHGQKLLIVFAASDDPDRTAERGH